MTVGACPCEFGQVGVIRNKILPLYGQIRAIGAFPAFPDAPDERSVAISAPGLSSGRQEKAAAFMGRPLGATVSDLLNLREVEDIGFSLVRACLDA